jgi:Mn-containing catalase
MYHHVKKLMYDVNVGEPDVRFGKILLEQFGGANGELAAAMQYTVQGWSCDDPERKDLLMDIGTEEISHLEIVGALIRMHMKPVKKALERAEEDPLVAVTGGGGLNLLNSAGNPWTADYLKISGELDVDLRNNIAAEARAKITYERLMHLTDDRGTKEALQFLMTREITHMKAFTAALDSLGKDRFTIGLLPPTPGIVDEYYNDSTGDGPLGKDGVGSWIGRDGLRVANTPEFIQEIGKSIKKGEELARKSSSMPPTATAAGQKIA